MKKGLLLLALICLSGLSYSQILLDDHNKAVDCLHQAQELLQNEQYQEAIPQLEQALAIDSTLRDGYLLLFTACYNTKNTETPKRYLKKAKTIFEEDDEVIYYLGKVYQLEKDYDNAIAEFTEAIRWSNQNGQDYPIVYDYYASRGACYLMQSRYEEALTDFDDSLKLNDTKPAVYANRGFALRNLNRPVEACDSWIKAYDLGLTSVKRYLDMYCQ